MLRPNIRVLVSNVNLFAAVSHCKEDYSLPHLQTAGSRFVYSVCSLCEMQVIQRMHSARDCVMLDMEIIIVCTINKRRDAVNPQLFT